MSMSWVVTVLELTGDALLARAALAAGATPVQVGVGGSPHDRIRDQWPDLDVRFVL
jgi:hypothetical protein